MKHYKYEEGADFLSLGLVLKRLSFLFFEACEKFTPLLFYCCITQHETISVGHYIVVPSEHVMISRSSGVSSDKLMV